MNPNRARHKIRFILAHTASSLSLEHVVDPARKELPSRCLDLSMLFAFARFPHRLQSHLTSLL